MRSLDVLPVFNKPLNELTFTDLENLITNQIPESEFLDYKESYKDSINWSGKDIGKDIFQRYIPIKKAGIKSNIKFIFHFSYILIIDFKINTVNKYKYIIKI